MRHITFPISIVIVLGAVVAAVNVQGQPSTSEAAGRTPPVPPHWYQSVGHGVTLTNLTPVAYFRGLLGMTPAERQRVLAGQPPERQTLVLAKVREYEALPREVREERMRQTELHWYLLKLLRMNPPERTEQLKEISPLYQPIIMSQLDQWDRLPESLRKALLTNEGFLSTYVQWQRQSPAGQQAMLSLLPAGQRADWAQELGRWQGLNESRREELCQQFRQFFYLSGEERKETIESLSEAERRQMEQALGAYANLPPEMQRHCVESFSKFAEMSPEERNQFLQNAARWEAMTGRERQLWRKLVNRLPPMPPGYNQSKGPPMPPGFPQAAAGEPGVANMAEVAR